MHNTIIDLHQILKTQTKPTTLHLTKTRHIHIKSIWREALKDYKLIHTCPTLDPNTNRRSGGTILAVSRDTYKDANGISPPPHIGDYISAAKLTPQDGSPIISVSAYMQQRRTKAQDTIYAEILTWIHTEIISKFSTMTILMGGNLQATLNEEDERSHYTTLSQFCLESRLKHITPKDTHTYIPAKHVDIPLATETTNHNHTLYELKHNDHYPHSGIRRPQGPSP